MIKSIKKISIIRTKRISLILIFIFATILSIRADDNISLSPIYLEPDCFLNYPKIESVKKSESYSNFNILDFSYIVSEKNQIVENTKDIDTRNFGVSFDTYNDYHWRTSFGSISILTSLNFTTYSNSFYNETIDNTITLKNELTVTEARLKYSDNYNNAYTIGILPMFRGVTYKYDNFDFTRNDGSQYISGLILQGVEYTHRFGNTDPLFISLGYGYYEKFHVNSIELHTKQMRGSDGSFLYVKKIKQLDEYSNLEYNGEITKINYVYDGILGYEQYLMGNTLTYFDEANTIWGYLGLQTGEGDNTPLVRKYAKVPGNVPDWALHQQTQSTYIGEYKTNGGNFALGYKRSFDIADTENFILFEYYKTFGEWVSPNLGTPFSAYGLGNLGTQYKVSAGSLIDNNILFKVTYLDFHYDGNHQYGGSMKQNDIYINGTKDREQQIIVNLEFLF